MKNKSELINDCVKDLIMFVEMDINLKKIKQPKDKHLLPILKENETLEHRFKLALNLFCDNLICK